MDKYVEGFRVLELTPSGPIEAGYDAAKQYADRFQRASVVAETPVRYSSNSSNLIKNHSNATICWK